ncbi:MAG: hypothetical protein J6Z34_03395 [Clostridia bacterium]|nr:hypothetical protein [Clostridia bacterium]
MKVWLISVAAVIILTSCAEMMLPSGKIKNACRTVFALVCLAVMLKPLSFLTRSFTGGAFEETVDYDYVEGANAYFCGIYGNEVKKLLSEKGYAIRNVDVEGRFAGGGFVVEKVFVKLEKTVISGEDEHIISIEEITSVICSHLGITSEKVAFYGS